MGDRQDIDALLIGALYGELDGDDRARLDAHLASHPGDRAALDGLRSTRAAVRDSGVTAGFGAVEPAAAVSARLLQEAARRAPAPPVGQGLLGFLASLFRPIAQHPALSATAALVLVIGIGSMMMKRGEWKVSQPAPQTASSSGAAGSGSAAANAEPATIAAPETPPGGYAVGLDNGVGAKQQAAGDDLDGLADERQLAAREHESAAEGRIAKDQPTAAKPAATRAAAKGAGSGYLEVDKRAAGSDLAMASPDSPPPVDRDGEDAPAVNRTAEESRPSIAPSMGGQVATSRGAVPAAPPPSIAQAPAPADPDAATLALKKEAENEAWARDQHARMVKLVNAGKCTEAGVIGAAIARKAPEYYQSAVANDRAVRSCQAYVDRARRAKAPAPKSKAGNQQQPERVDDLEQAK